MTRRELFQRVTGAVLASGVAGLVQASPTPAAPPVRRRPIGSPRVFGGVDPIIADSLHLQFYVDGYRRCQFDIMSAPPQIGDYIALDLPTDGVVFQGTVTEISMRSTHRSTFRTRVSAEDVSRHQPQRCE